MSEVKPRIFHQPKQNLADILPLDTPFSVHLDVCSTCNFTCTFCFQNDKQGMKDANISWGMMDLQVFKRCVDDLKKFPQKIKKIKIGNHGEPTLHPDLPEMIKYARDANVAHVIEMFTNGSKLNPELNQKLVDSGLQRINISVEGLTKESYKRIAGYNINYDEFIANITDLYNRKTLELSMYIKVVDHAVVKSEPGKPTIDLSPEDKEHFFSLFGSISDEMSIENIVPQWAETDQNELTEVGMYGQKIEYLKKVCPFPFMYLHVNSDGSVAGCTLDWARKVLVGNLGSNSSLFDIWNGEGMKQLRLRMLKGERDQIPMCDSCNAPNVCVIDDLDPCMEQLIERYN
ncbi:radical SAM/SPASM domain-containing protein [Synechococcus sp. W4D4]|uniref:radical SAM/SPASM domain-containing protein n=1 Tax=Synechococcus sp. W4D4 TaxID=3392294 RepID=UPI0039E7D362